MYPLFPIVIYSSRHQGVNSEASLFEITTSSSFRYAAFHVHLPDVLPELLRVEAEGCMINEDAHEKGDEALFNAASSLSETQLTAVVGSVLRRRVRRSAPVEVVTNTLTERGLLSLLRSYAVPLSYWGREEGSLPLAFLLRELREGVCSLHEQYGRIFRALELVTVDLYHRVGSHEWYRLEHERSLGENRQSRDLVGEAAALRIKAPHSSGPRTIALDALCTLLDQEFSENRILLMGRRHRIADSLTFPGLITSYLETHFAVTLNDTEYLKLQPTAHPALQRLFRWVRIDEPGSERRRVIHKA